MKTTLLLFLLSAGVVAAQAPMSAPPAPPPFTPEQLDQLTAPIALYPDPLVAILLPASAASNDLVQAAALLATGGNFAQIDQEPWDPSVKALTHYPTLVTWLDQNLGYTQQLGEAFTAEPAEVMKSIQRLRSQALLTGALRNTPQQIVYTQNGQVIIEPAQQDAIYVPDYDPAVLYGAAAFDYDDWMSFGYPWAVGPWLGYECDWAGAGIWIGVWHPGWRHFHHREDRGLVVAGGGHYWHPNPHQVAWAHRDIVRPVAAVGPRIVREVPQPARFQPLAQTWTRMSGTWAPTARTYSPPPSPPEYFGGNGAYRPAGGYSEVRGEAPHNEGFHGGGESGHFSAPAAGGGGGGGASRASSASSSSNDNRH